MDPAGEEELGGERHEEESGLQRVLKAVPIPDSKPPATGAGKAEGEGSDADVPAPPASAEPAAAPKPKFKLGDMEFESEEQAVHAHKSLRGQAASVAQRARDLSNQQQEFVRALAQAGLSLDATGKVVRAEGAPAAAPHASTSSAPPSQGRATGQPSGPVDLTSDEGVRSFLDSALNWKQLPQVIKMYEEQHGVTIGAAATMRLVMENVLPKLVQEMQGHVKGAIEPLSNIIGSQQAAGQVRDLFHGVGEFVFHDGASAYPELHDPAKASEIHQVWLDLGNDGIPPAVLMTPKGVIMAVEMWRAVDRMRSRATGGAPAPNAVPSNAPPAAQPQANVDQATQAVRDVMRSIEAARGSVSPDLGSSEGQPFRPAGAAEDHASRVRAAIRGSRGQEVIPGVRFS